MQRATCPAALDGTPSDSQDSGGPVARIAGPVAGEFDLQEPYMATSTTPPGARSEDNKSANSEVS